MVLFVVDSGPCTVDSTATCFSSPNYQSTYGNLQQCFITAHEAVTLSVTAFSTEAGYDKFTVNGVHYSGTTGPEGVQVAAGSTIIWRSGYRPGAGFEICGETFTITPTITGQTWTPTTSPTSAPTSPTVSPTTASPTTVSPTATPNPLEDNSSYQACIASPSTCTSLYVPLVRRRALPHACRPERSCPRTSKAVTPHRGWRSRCSHSVVRALVRRGWLIRGS